MPVIACPIPNCTYATDDVDAIIAVALLNTHAIINEIAGLRANMAQLAVFAEIEAGTRFFASGSRGVSGTQIINKDFQL